MIIFKVKDNLTPINGKIRRRDSFQYLLEGYKCLGGKSNHIISLNVFQFLVFSDSLSGVRH